MGFFSKISEGLKKTRDSFAKKVEAITNSFTTIDDDLMDELEETLILSDVGVTTSQHIVGGAAPPHQGAGGHRCPGGQGAAQGDHRRDAGGRPGAEPLHQAVVILVIGVNGVGKTTTIGKLAHQLKEEGKTVLLAAADTFRAAAIDQLEIWADRAGVDLIKHQEGSDPAAVVFDAVNAWLGWTSSSATPPRLHNKKNRLDELAKISRVIARELPDSALETLLVLDGTTDNALNQAKLFGEAAGLTGIVLTKLDGTARGGVVIGIKEELKIPVKYIGVGEGIDDLRPFDPVDFADALFGEESSKEIPQEEAPIPQEEE